MAFCYRGISTHNSSNNLQGLTYSVVCCSRWAILFSHPADYTPVCTTELGLASQKADEFKKRNVKLIALSCDDVDAHAGWSKVTWTAPF